MLNKITTYLFILSIFYSTAQETDSSSNTIQKNTFYIEAFGQGLYDSFSFDHLFNTEYKVKNSISGGVTYCNIDYLYVIAAPVSYNFIFGQKKHHLELGIGLTAMLLDQKDINASQLYVDQYGNLQNNSYIGYQVDLYSYFTPKIAYRYQKPEGGFFFRLAFTPALAGINRIGSPIGGNNKGYYYYEFFSSAAFFDSRAFPWAGISFGYTLKQ